MVSVLLAPFYHVAIELEAHPSGQAPGMFLGYTKRSSGWFLLRLDATGNLGNAASARTLLQLDMLASSVFF
jgi:hypothetical protein